MSCLGLCVDFVFLIVNTTDFVFAGKEIHVYMKVLTFLFIIWVKEKKVVHSMHYHRLLILCYF